jgi:hypothetical protein
LSYRSTAERETADAERLVGERNKTIGICVKRPRLMPSAVFGAGGGTFHKTLLPDFENTMPDGPGIVRFKDAAFPRPA